MFQSAQSAVNVEYTDCISEKEYGPTNECPGYNTKQSDGEALVKLDLGECGVPLHCHLLPGPV